MQIHVEADWSHVDAVRPHPLWMEHYASDIDTKVQSILK